MKKRSLIFGVVAASCAMSVTLPRQAWAAVSDEDFNALKKMVQQLGEKVQNLDQVHQRDQQVHQQDQQKIQQLQQELTQTHQIATNAVQKAEAAAQVQPVHPTPNGTSALHNFTMVGDAEVQFGKTRGQHSAFTLADFAPIFLYRANDSVLFEAGFDVTLQNGATSLPAPASHNGGSTTSVNLSFAQLDYLLNDYMMVVAGDMVLPLGTYSERTAGWLNKIPDDPMARGFLPGSGIGAQLRGAVPVGDSGQLLTYSFYGVNGPSSMDGSGNSAFLDGNGNLQNNLDLGGNVGNAATANLHGNPSGGGRLGWFFPLKAHTDLELGISGQTGEWDDAGSHLWSAGILDAALHVSPYFEVKGEYINTWYGTDDIGVVHPRGLWVQAAYKLAGAGLELPLINNVELVGRYDNSNDGQGTKTDRYTAGYVYYFTNTLLFEGDYEWLHSRGPLSLPAGQFVLQLSYGF